MTNTDPESRLRDYLATKADTVPQNATPSHLELTTRRRYWPTLVAAAASAAVAAGIVPVIAGMGDDHPEVAQPAPGPVRTVTGGPAGAVKGSPPELPFLVGDADLASRSATVHDGSTRVVTPAAPFTGLVGRASNGWVIRIGGSKTAVGHLDRDGRFRRLSPDSDWAFVSPDKTQIAVSRRVGEANRLAIVDIATGKELHTLDVDYERLQVYGWNRDGVWFSDYDEPASARPHVWRPGSDPRQVTAPGFISLTAPSTTDRIALTLRVGKAQCDRVVSVRDGQFVPLRERCANDGRAHYPVLSPDGTVLAYPEEGLALLVDSGEVVRLNGAPAMAIAIASRFEDADHLLVPSQTSRATKTGREPTEEVTRCNVRTGSCRSVYRTPEGSTVSLGTP